MGRRRGAGSGRWERQNSRDEIVIIIFQNTDQSTAVLVVVMIDYLSIMSVLVSD